MVLQCAAYLLLARPLSSFQRGWISNELAGASQYLDVQILFQYLRLADSSHLASVLPLVPPKHGVPTPEAGPCRCQWETWHPNAVHSESSSNIKKKCARSKKNKCATCFALNVHIYMHISHVICQMSYEIYHMSNVHLTYIICHISDTRYHISDIKCHISNIKYQRSYIIYHIQAPYLSHIRREKPHHPHGTAATQKSHIR